MKTICQVCILFVFAISACVSNETVTIDKEPPTMTIAYPVTNTVYKPGDTVFINTVFSDNNLVKKGSIHIHDQFLPRGADTVFVCNFLASKKSLAVDTFYVVNDPNDKNYVIYFDAIDEAENLTEKLRYFYQHH